MTELTKRDRQVRRWTYLGCAVIVVGFWSFLYWVTT